MKKQDIQKQLEDFYNGEIPPYVLDADKKSITMNAASVLEDKATPRKITQEDVADYFVKYGQDFMSSIRTLKDIQGDHRPMNNMANECMSWFRHVDINGFRKVCKAKGLTPKF